IDLPRTTEPESGRPEREEWLANSEAPSPATGNAAAEAAPEAAPEAGPEAGSEVAPEATPEAVPETAPATTDEATADAVPEAAPAATHEATAESATEEEPATQQADAEAAVEPVGATAFVTETLAELYLRQGHLTDALAIYHQVAARRPEDTALQERIARLESAQASRAATQRAGRTVRELFATVMTRRAPPHDRSGGQLVAATAHAAERASGTASAASPVGADGLFAVNVVPTEDDARAGVLAAAYLADATREASPGTSPDAESFSLEHVFRDEPGAATLPSASMSDVSFDEFFARKPEETPLEPRGSATPPSETKPGDDDLELFQAWLEGLKK
ncbi:MAG: hypothetical protein ACRENC_05975, partial [Gemmatimonadaceae bacterium]